VYALTAFVEHLERVWDNPGVRVVVSYGSLIPLSDPDALQKNPGTVDFTRNWLALTGVDEAFTKCWKAEQEGSRLGFRRGFFWHEALDTPRTYLGTAVRPLGDAMLQAPELYPSLYRELVESSTESATLPE
jgi:hypothetical protein